MSAERIGGHVVNAQIYEEAGDWLVKNREGDLDAQEKTRFDAWLRESPQHVRAYLEISAVWEDVASLAPSQNAAPEELITRARAEENIVPLESASALRPPGVGEAGSCQRTVPILGKVGLFYSFAASVLLIVAGTWLYNQRNTYSTGVGEQRSIALVDGSSIELNSRSRVRVRFSTTERDIDLIRGQALFRVAKNPLRPFVVSTNGTQVRAIGTEFDVYRRISDTVVTVVEGQVAVFEERHPSFPFSQAEGSSAGVHSLSERQDAGGVPPQVSGEGRGPRSGPGNALLSGDGAIVLAAGEQLTVSAVTAAKARPQPSLKRANVAAATAWTQRSLVFESSPLTEVAEEFNRYNTRPLIITDPMLANMHVSGVFSSVDPALLLRFLRSQPELVVEETEKEIRISKK